MKRNDDGKRMHGTKTFQNNLQMTNDERYRNRENVKLLQCINYDNNKIFCENVEKSVELHTDYK